MSQSTSTEPFEDVGNAVIAHTLHWLAVLLEIDERDPAHVTDYRHAAHVIRALEPEASALVRATGPKGLERLGIAPAVCVVISDWVRTGECPWLTETYKRRPGLWPALTRALFHTLGIEPVRPPRRRARRPGPRASRPSQRPVWESWH